MKVNFREFLMTSIAAAAMVIFCASAPGNVSAKGAEGEGADGLLIHLERSQVGDYSVTGATLVSRFVDRAGTGAPVKWVVEVVGPSGEILWDGLIPAVTLPHLAENPDRSREFSILIPSRFESGRVRLRDDTGAGVFEFPINDALAESARASRQGMLAEIEAMRRDDSATIQNFQAEGHRPGQSLVAAQMRHELSRQAALPVPDLEAAAAGIWQDTGDRPAGIPDKRFRPEPARSPRKNGHETGQSAIEPVAGQFELSEFDAPVELEAEIEISRELERRRLVRLGLLAGPAENRQKQPGAASASRQRSPGTATDSVTLTGNVEFAGGASPDEGFWAVLRNDNGSFYDSDWVGTDKTFEFEVPAGRTFELQLQAPPPFLLATFSVQIDRDTSRIYRLERGALLVGEIETSDGGAFPDDFWIFLYRDNDFVSSHLVQQGGFEMVLEPDVQYKLRFSPPIPYLPKEQAVTLSDDAVLTFEVELGVALDGRAVTSDGRQFSESFWISFRRAEDRSHFDWARADIDGNFRIALEPDVEFVAQFSPPTPYLRTDAEIALTADQERTFTIERGAVLDGRLVTSNGEDFAESFWISFRREDFSWFGSAEVDETGRFTITLEPGVIYMVDFRVPVPYLGQFRVPVSLASDGERSFPVERGTVLDGQLVTSDGGEFSENFRIAFFRENENLTYNIATVAIDGRFQTVLEPNARYSARISPPVPYLEVRKTFELAEDASRSIEIQRGVVVRLGVFNEDGTPELAEGIIVSQSGASRSFWPESTSRLPVVIEPQVPAVISVRPDNAELMVRNIPLEPRNVDFNLDVVLPQGRSLSGVVEDRDGEPVGFAELRFYQGDRFVKSVETLGDGTYELMLPQGRYRVRISVSGGARMGPDRSVAVFEADPKAIDIDASEQTFDARLARPMHALTIARFHPAESFMRARLTFTQGNRRGGNIHTWASGDDIQVMDGVYDIEIDYPGFASVRVTGFDISSDSTLDLSEHLSGSPALWSGVLRGPEGHPLVDVGYTVYDGAHQFRFSSRTNPLGEFTLPLGEGLYAEFGGGPGFSADGGLVKELVDLDRPLRSVQADVKLGGVEFPAASLTAGEVTRMLGDRPAEDVYDILFLGDGYTDVRETFTDQNGNGIWDGVLFVDIDGNGVWDRGEPVTTYGDATFDYTDDDGTDVSADNEPFDDINQDGFPNFDDREVFATNIRNFMRAILGSHVWSDHPGLFNAHALFTPSAESGTGVINEEGEPLIQRDTVFSSNLHTERSLLRIDYQKASSMAAEAVPEHDLIVVLLNQPVPMGRANSFIVSNGGMNAGSPASTIPHHEMGHALAFLADEYQELQRTYEGTEPRAVNVTTMSDPAAIPWSEFLEADTPLPTAPLTPGTGLFTGGLYHYGGVFRPTENSTMRHNAPKFNAISEKAARDILCERFEVDCPAALAGGLFWFNPATGETRVWGMDGVIHQSVGRPPGIVDPRWSLAGVGDFDGNEAADFFWRAPDVGPGRNRVWLLDGATRTAGAAIPSIGSDWTYAGAGDFNGDGRDDLLWRQTFPVTGQNRVWTMDGVRREAGSAIPVFPGAQWQPIGIGDFDGDGKSDIVWRNFDRPQTRIWMMDGFSIAAGRALPVMPNAWQVADVGDFDGDGKADLLWRNEAVGQNRIWLMNGGSVKQRGTINRIGPSSWKVAGTGDLDLDGKADIVWRNVDNGRNRVWLMDGLTRKQGAAIPVQSDTNWQIIGVGRTDAQSQN